MTPACDVSAVAVSSVAEWRCWLARNCRSETHVWLVVRHVRSTLPGVRYAEAIGHALCYGWIDSHARKRDPDSFYLRFSPRRPRSRWSRVNRQRAAAMTDLGLMTEHGRAAIERAKATGTWQTALP